MYRFTAFLFLCGLAAAMPAMADTCTFELGGGSYVDTSGTHDVLSMTADVLDSVAGTSFTLTEGESHTFLFALMTTSESWINEEDDLTPGSVTALLDFDLPDSTGQVGGTTNGFFSGWWIFQAQGWTLVWDDPVLVDTPTCSFEIELSDASHMNGVWQGPAGPNDNCIEGNIWATVTLLDVKPVPEPASIGLLAIGLAGLAWRRVRGKVA